MNREELLAKLKELYNIYDYITHSDTTTVEASKVRDDIDELIVMLTPRTRAEIMKDIGRWCEKEEYAIENCEKAIFLVWKNTGMCILAPAEVNHKVVHGVSNSGLSSYLIKYNGSKMEIPLPPDIAKLLIEYWEAVE